MASWWLSHIIYAAVNSVYSVLRIIMCPRPRQLNHDDTFSALLVLHAGNPLVTNNMMTSSNGNIFRVTGPLCGEFTGPGEFPTQRPVTRIFDVFFDLGLNKRLNKQSWGWWFETLSRPFWRHRNEFTAPRVRQGIVGFFVFTLDRQQIVEWPRKWDAMVFM